MTLSTQPYKGARDFYPEDKRLQKYIFGKLRTVAESFGYEEYDAPILEPTELYLSKGNEEIINEQTYTFIDRGDRSVTVRTEMTPTVSRMVAGRRQELAYPVRWYSIPNLWRYERAQRGRLREFWQLNIDIFGVAGIEAEHEVIQLADQTFKTFGASADMYTININSRQLMDYITLSYLGLDQVQSQMLSKLIDRIRKISPQDFDVQADAILSPSQRDAGVLAKLRAVLQAKTIADLPDDVKAQPAAAQLQQLLVLLGASKVTNAFFDITIMRGFDYYTDIVFEIMDTDPENNRAMAGGGRYDGMVALFGVEPVPTVGFAMGDVTLQNFLESHNLLPQPKPETDLRVLLIGEGIYEKSLKILNDLRGMGVNIAVDTSGRKIDKQFKAAGKTNVRYALVIGDTELENEQFVLKDLFDNTEATHGLERIVSIVKDRRS